MKTIVRIFLGCTACVTLNCYAEVSIQEQERRFQQRRVERLQKEAAEKASTKDHRSCEDARWNLGVLKEARSVYRYDNKGERQYVSDNDRQAEISRAQAAVAKYCD